MDDAKALRAYACSGYSNHSDALLELLEDLQCRSLYALSWVAAAVLAVHSSPGRGIWFALGDAASWPLRPDPEQRIDAEMLLDAMAPKREEPKHDPSKYGSHAEEVVAALAWREEQREAAADRPVREPGAARQG